MIIVLKQQQGGSWMRFQKFFLDNSVTKSGCESVDNTGYQDQFVVAFVLCFFFCFVFFLSMALFTERIS